MARQSGIKFDADEFFRGLDVLDTAVAKAAEFEMDRATDDLLRISSNIAPIDKSTLRKSGKKYVKWRYGAVVGAVTFSAVESSSGYGRFNYALWTHEQDYELGEQSAAAPGTDGYEVGNKYVERPLKGESVKYLKWLTEGVAGVLGS
jgi:hypothetical protein